MKVLFLGYLDSPLIPYLESAGETVIAREAKLGREEVAALGADFLVSYGYRHILKPDLLALFPERTLNLHISYLPWNRGTDPNFWSFVENTPKGVTLHRIDAGIDTGAIVAQKEVRFRGDETLKSSYELLRAEIEALFREWWPRIRAGEVVARPQSGPGSCHKKSDKAALEHLLVNGWDTPVRLLVGQRKP